MDPWLLRQLDSLKSRLDRTGANSSEARALRNEIDSIGNASFGIGPLQTPLYHSTSDLERRLENLEKKNRPW